MKVKKVFVSLLLTFVLLSSVVFATDVMPISVEPEKIVDITVQEPSTTASNSQEARLIVIQPWDASLLKEIEKEILKAEIGINPNNDGKVIRLAFPELTEERRKELVKEIRKMGEESKVSVRSIRREGMDIAKAKQKEGEITEDELKAAEDKIQIIK